MGRIPLRTPKRHEWPTLTKNRLKGLAQAGWTYKNIAEKDKEHVPPEIVRRLVLSDESRRSGRLRQDKPAKLMIEDVDRLVEMVTMHGWHGRAYTWDGFTKDANLQVCF